MKKRECKLTPAMVSSANLQISSKNNSVSFSTELKSRSKIIFISFTFTDMDLFNITQNLPVNSTANPSVGRKPLNRLPMKRLFIFFSSSKRLRSSKRVLRRRSLNCKKIKPKIHNINKLHNKITKLLKIIRTQGNIHPQITL